MGWAYVVFNVGVAVGVYWVFRVRKGSGRSVGERLRGVLGLFRRGGEKDVGAEKEEGRMAMGGAMPGGDVAS